MKDSISKNNEPIDQQALAEEEGDFSLAFLDILMNSLVVFIGMTAILICMVNPKMENNGIEKKAEFVVMVEWDSDSTDDVDSYLQDPAGNICMYQRREDGLMHLDRDDLGQKNDQVKTADGEIIKFSENRETISIRAIIPGEYVMNVHMFSKRNEIPTEVRVKLMKLNPKVMVVTSGKHVMSHHGDEHTMFRFTVDKDGTISDINHSPKKLINPNNISIGGYSDGDYSEEDQ